MFQLRNTYPIGIDLGEQNIYALQLKQSRQGATIRGLVHGDLQEAPQDTSHADDALASLLEEVRKSGQFSGKRAVVHLPPRNIHSFPISFQVGTTETVEEAIVRESKEHLPFPLPV